MTTDILILINIIFGLAIVYFSIYFTVKAYTPQWIAILYTIVGIVWSVVYILVLLDYPYTNTLDFGTSWVRPAITLTLGVILAGKISTWYRLPKRKNHDSREGKNEHKHR